MTGSVWLETSTVEERDHTGQLDSDHRCDVVVIGAGITGLTCALLLQRAGKHVVVLEASGICTGTTGGTTGKVTSQHGLFYARTARSHGVEVARKYAEANENALGKIASLVDELSIDCEFTRAPAYVYTMRPDRENDIEQEATVARLIGLPASFTRTCDLPYDIVAAVRFENQAHFHARRYCIALANEIVRNGGHIYCESRATDVDDADDHVTVSTAHAKVWADAAIVTTLLPLGMIGGFFARTRPYCSYGLAARTGSPALEGMHITDESPIRSTRPWNTADGPGIIVVGNGHETGTKTPTSAALSELETWMLQHFDVTSVAHRWFAEDFHTADGLPYVGRSPGSTHTYVATGFAKWGLTNSMVAATLLRDLIAGNENSPVLDVYDARRIGNARSIGKTITDNAKVGVHFVKKHLAKSKGDVSTIQRGEGGLIDVDGQTIGAYRDEEGQLHCVNVTCTHMGCRLEWNDMELSWDCPCHGSRFAHTGDVLTGPAVRPLRVIHVDDPDSR